MKRLVGSTFLLSVTAGIVAAVIVAVTGAGAGATYLIGFGFTAVVIAIRLGPERVELWRRQGRQSPPARGPAGS